MTLIESFGLFIETAGPRRAAKRLREQVGEEVVETVRKTWSGKILTLGTRRPEIEASLGKPDYSEGRIIGYALPQKAGYYYTFEFEPAGNKLIQTGYRRINAAALPAKTPASALEWEKFSRQMASQGATSAEVEKLLGKPNDHYGWFPMETWEYPLGAITFCNGIVVTNEEEWSIPSSNAKPDAFQ